MFFVLNELKRYDNKNNNNLIKMIIAEILMAINGIQATNGLL